MVRHVDERVQDGIEDEPLDAGAFGHVRHAAGEFGLPFVHRRADMEHNARPLHGPAHDVVVEHIADDRLFGAGGREFVGSRLPADEGAHGRAGGDEFGEAAASRLAGGAR